MRREGDEREEVSKATLVGVTYQNRNSLLSLCEHEARAKKERKKESRQTRFLSKKGKRKREVNRLTSDMALLSSLLSEPLGEDVVHGGRRESDVERELGVVSSHAGDVEVFGEGDFHRRRSDSKDLNDLSNSVGSVVEEEEGVVVCGT